MELGQIPEKNRMMCTDGRYLSVYKSETEKFCRLYSSEALMVWRMKSKEGIPQEWMIPHVVNIWKIPIFTLVSHPVQPNVSWCVTIWLYTFPHLIRVHLNGVSKGCVSGGRQRRKRRKVYAGRSWGKNSVRSSEYSQSEPFVIKIFSQQWTLVM